MNYSWLYGASFSASTELQTMASGWYENGTEVIFACGGNMFQSVAAAAAANDGAVVGVDVDQSSQSDTVITSAMKGLSASVQWACGKVYDGSFDEIGGTFVTLGAKDNAVGLPTATWSPDQVDCGRLQRHAGQDGRWFSGRRQRLLQAGQHRQPDPEPGQVIGTYLTKKRRP